MGLEHLTEGFRQFGSGLGRRDVGNMMHKLVEVQYEFDRRISSDRIDYGKGDV